MLPITATVSFFMIIAGVLNSVPGRGMTGGLTGLPARLLESPGAAVLSHHHVGLRLQVVPELRPDQLLLLPLLEDHQDGLLPVYSGAVLPPAVREFNIC